MPSCNGCGPGYASPMQAYNKGIREKVAYLTCVVPDKKRPDYIATIDLDPDSPTYSTVISRLHMPYLGDEIHHSGWNACSSCYDDPTRSRSRLIAPCLGSDRIYVIDTKTDPRNPKLEKVIEPWEVHAQGVSSPHTTHCLADGNVMISTMGDGKGKGNGKGSFLLLDGETFRPMGTWPASKEDETPFGYDFWYQPYHNVMVSSQWGHPRCFKEGFDPADVAKGNYSSYLDIWDWKQRKHIQKVNLGVEGTLPLEMRFLHDPKATEGYVAGALFANLFRFYKTNKGDWAAEKVLDIPAKKVDGWLLPEMPGVMSDILISMDDQYLYLSNWVHGDVRQYDISDTRNPRLTGQVWMGGCIQAGGPVTVTEDQEMSQQPDVRYHKGKRIYGGPHNLQLSLDGKRLYVTTFLYTPWDKVFHPEGSVKHGSMMMMIDVDTKNGGMQLNNDFLVDFGDEPGGPVCGHEIRWNGADCTSDIFLADMEQKIKMNP